MTRRALPRWATLAILFHAWLYGCTSIYITKGNGGAGSGGGGGADAGSPDAASPDADGGKCVAVKVGELPDGGGPACPSDAGCFPGDVTTFSPQPLRPLIATTPHANLCTPTQISEWYSKCGMQTGNCQAWLGSPANASCGACIQTPHTAAQQGAVITYTGSSVGVYHVNFWGCLALVEPCNVSCAQALQAQSECQDTACNPESGPCLVHDQASGNAYASCIEEAPNCGCTGFNGPAVSCQNAIVSAPKDHLAVATCGLGEGFEPLYTKVATFLCGP